MYLKFVLWQLGDKPSESHVYETRHAWYRLCDAETQEDVLAFAQGRDAEFIWGERLKEGSDEDGIRYIVVGMEDGEGERMVVATHCHLYVMNDTGKTVDSLNTW